MKKVLIHWVEMLLLAKQYRDELNRLMGVVSEKDYADPGDKVTS
jgi:hypothetical protein